ncbi:hypothetical protein CR513_47099, partial [Mucuna pruriens]
MIAFFDAYHTDMWDIVENGNYIPTDKEGAKLPRSSWNDKQKIRVSKDLKKLPMEELLGMLNVHEVELNEDERQRKGKSRALKTQKTQKGSLSKAFRA